MQIIMQYSKYTDRSFRTIGSDLPVRSFIRNQLNYLTWAKLGNRPHHGEFHVKSCERVSKSFDRSRIGQNPAVLGYGGCVF